MKAHWAVADLGHLVASIAIHSGVMDAPVLVWSRVAAEALASGRCCLGSKRL